MIRDKHKGETILIIASGPSVNDFNVDDLHRYTTIGVNQSARRLDCDYVTLLDTPVNWGRSMLYGMRAMHKSKTLLAKANADLWHKRMPPHMQEKIDSTVIEFDLLVDWAMWEEAQYREVVDGWEDGPAKSLPYSVTSTGVAVWGAAFMGAARIGLIGVDLGDYYFFHSDKAHATPPEHAAKAKFNFGKLAEMVQKLTGATVWNLSNQSLIDTVPKDELALWLLE